MTMELSSVGGALGASRDADSARATGWSIDTRTIEEGDVFFAIAVRATTVTITSPKLSRRVR